MSARTRQTLAAATRCREERSVVLMSVFDRRARWPCRPAPTPSWSSRCLTASARRWPCPCRPRRSPRRPTRAGADLPPKPHHRFDHISVFLPFDIHINQCNSFDASYIERICIVSTLPRQLRYCHSIVSYLTSIWLLYSYTNYSISSISVHLYINS